MQVAWRVSLLPVEALHRGSQRTPLAPSSPRAWQQSLRTQKKQEKRAGEELASAGRKYQWERKEEWGFLVIAMGSPGCC